MYTTETHIRPSKHIQVDRTYKTQSNFQWHMPLVLNYGLLSGVSMIVYYFLMDLFDHETIIYFRFFNLFLMTGISFLALRSFYKKFSRPKTSYLSGLLTGAAVNGVGALILSAFTTLTLTLAAPETAAEIVDRLPIDNIHTVTLGLMLFIETSILGVVASFIAMQFYKDNQDTPAQ